MDHQSPLRSPFPSTRGRMPAVIAALALVAGGAGAQTPVAAPQPTVPEIFTVEGEFVRVAYNNEGYASMGYRMAQEQVGQEWVMLQAGLTLRKPTKDYNLKRDHLSITTPDGKNIPLATQQEYRGAMAAVSSLDMRAKVAPDSINYFPNDVSRGCALRFFPDDRGATLAFDETELSWSRACLGRLYFRIPGGVQIGQHWLNVQFAGSSLQVPFRILTKEEEKELSKRWQELKKQHEASFKD
jgi:uncharacterized protein (DUF1684 family)